MIRIKVKVIGSDAKSRETHTLIKNVTNENGIPIRLETIEEMGGIKSTLRVTVGGKIAHEGGVPDKKTILSWFSSSCCPADDNCC